MRKVQFPFFKSLFLALAKFLFWKEDWKLGCNYMKFWDSSNISWFPKILSLKSLGNLWVHSSSLVIISNAIISNVMFSNNDRTSFHLWWKENLVKDQTFSKHYAMIFFNFFFLIFMSLLLFLIVKNNHKLAGTYFIFLKIHTRRNFKNFQYQIWASVKRSEKQLSSNTNFSTFLYFLVSSSNFRLKLC